MVLDAAIFANAAQALNDLRLFQEGEELPYVVEESYDARALDSGVLVTQPSRRTNITEPLRKYDSSRGDLTRSFLLPKAPSSSLQAEIDEFLEENRDRAYAGFNLLILSPSPSTIGDLGTHGLAYDGAFLTNHGGGGAISARMLSDEERRCGGMSNGVDHKGANEWPKVKHGTQTLRNLLQSLPRDATEAEIVDKLFALLT